MLRLWYGISLAARHVTLCVPDRLQIAVNMTVCSSLCLPQVVTDVRYSQVDATRKSRRAEEVQCESRENVLHSTSLQTTQVVDHDTLYDTINLHVGYNCDVAGLPSPTSSCALLSETGSATVSSVSVVLLEVFPPKKSRILFWLGS